MQIPKTQKDIGLNFNFALLGSGHIKAAHNYADDIDP